MSQQYSAQEPSDVPAAITELFKTAGSDKSLILRIYTRVNGKMLPLEQDGSDWFDASVLESLFNDWVLAIRSLQIPSLEHVSDGPLKLSITFDLTRHLLQETNRAAIYGHEARGLTRMSAVFRKIFRGRADLQARVLGVPCWCLHQEQASNVVLPLVDSWPLQRAAHEYDPGGRIPKQPSKCMKLAEEHWDDEHWNITTG